MCPQIHQNEQIFNRKSRNFLAHFSTFRAKNAIKSRPFKFKNNAQTIPKQLQNNFEKGQKTTFLTPKMVKNDPSKPPK